MPVVWLPPVMRVLLHAIFVRCCDVTVGTILTQPANINSNGTLGGSITKVPLLLGDIVGDIVTGRYFFLPFSACPTSAGGVFALRNCHWYLTLRPMISINLNHVLFDRKFLLITFRLFNPQQKRYHHRFPPVETFLNDKNDLIRLIQKSI